MFVLSIKLQIALFNKLVNEHASICRSMKVIPSMYHGVITAKLVGYIQYIYLHAISILLCFGFRWTNFTHEVNLKTHTEVVRLLL